MTGPKSGVTVILNGYRRAHTLRQQYEAVMSQTVKPAEVYFWQNKAPSPAPFDESVIGQCVAFRGNDNLGVWARFAFALMARTKYICVFDDDTIPGKRWLENCLSCSIQRPGLYGTIGVVFNSPNGYDGKQYRVGWDAPNEEVTQVDIVGHSWFFERDYLSYFWRELPDPRFRCVGEDMHFSHMLQKHAGIGTYVPPHPKGQLELWGSRPDLAIAYGADENATGNFGIPQMNEYIQECVANGFKLLKAGEPR